MSSPSLGEAVLHLVGDDTKLVGTTKGAKTKVDVILAKVGLGMKAAGVGIAATGAAITAVGGAVYGLAAKAAESADDILVGAQKAGISAEQYQKLSYASELVDVSVETMSGSMGKFVNVIGQAAASGDGFLQVTDELQVSLLGQDGQLRSTYDIWLDTLDALGSVSNETTRSILAQQLLGRSYQEVKPLIDAGKGALIAYGEEAVQAGAVIGGSQLEAAANLDDSIQRVKGTLNGLVIGLGSQLAPGVETFVSAAGGYLQKFTAIINDPSLTASEKISAASGLVKNIAQDISEKMPEMAETGIGILKTILTGIIDAIPALIPAVVQVVVSILRFLIEMLPLLMEGAIQILVALAEGLGEALPVLIPAIVEMVLMIVTTLIQQLPLLIKAALQLVIGLANGLMAAIPVLLEQAPALIEAILTALIEGIPMLVIGAVKLVAGFAMGLIQAIPHLIMAIPRILQALCNGILNGIPGMSNSGSQLMAGFWGGITSWFGKIASGVSEFIKGVVASIKDALDMHSPSGVGFAIGANFMGSTFAGMESELARAATLGAQSARSMTSATYGGLAPAVGTGETKNISFTIHNPVGESTDESMRRSLQKLAFLGVMG